MRKRRMLFLFPSKGRTGLGLPQGRCLRLGGKSPHFRPWAPGCIFLSNLVSAIAPLPLSCSKKESAYSDRWTHKKNVTMDKQNVNTTPSMKGKGDSSSSHYRINSGNGACERAVATKFVKWEVQPLETLCACKAYLLREKLNRGEAMSREEKDWLCEAVNSNTYFRTAVPVMGYRFDFFDVLKKYLVKQYGQWAEYYAPDRTSLRKHLYGRINQIVEIPKY